MNKKNNDMWFWLVLIFLMCGLLNLLGYLLRYGAVGR